MKRRVISFSLILFVTACSILQKPGEQPTLPVSTLPIEDAATVDAPEPQTSLSSNEILLYPEDLEYLGAFRLPEASGDSSWEYSGRGLTYFPDGAAAETPDGYPGSLFGVGFDQQNFVSEISIPIPVISRDLEQLNTASTLQPFADITNGIFGESDLPRLGIQYLPALDGQDGGKLHFVHGQHFQVFEPSHGWSELDLAHPDPAGPWLFGNYSNYVTSDYLFEIPEDWAGSLPGNPRLATGRFREGVWGGLGPALFAYSPIQGGKTPKTNAVLQGITPLILYGVQETGLPDIITDPTQKMVNYSEDDSWWGGAWLTSGDRAAVIFTGTKASGKTWYGFANGVVWEYDCAERVPPTCPKVPEWPYENRGYWAESYQPRILFFNPYDLVRVANGKMNTWDPQPYAQMDLSGMFYDPKISLENYKYDITGAAAFDRERGILFVVERLADGAKSVIHVWRIRN
jgi:hypothetical protein